jgi:hypothetical protein
MFCTDFISPFLLAIALGISLFNRQVVTRIVDYKTRSASAIARSLKKCCGLGNKAAISWLFTGMSRDFWSQQGAIWKKSRV